MTVHALLKALFRCLCSPPVSHGVPEGVIQVSSLLSLSSDRFVYVYRIVEHGRKVKTLSTKAMHEIVRNTTSAVPAVRPGFTHTKLVDQGGGKHALCVEIYLTKEGKALSNLELFPKPPPAGRGRRRFIHDDIDHTHPMQSCLEIILSSNKEWKAMDEQLNQGNRHMGLSLGNVMSKIEASPNLPSMIQPVGLHDITLHEYQKQSLKWMIDMENTPLRSKLWVPVNAEVGLYCV